MDEAALELQSLKDLVDDIAMFTTDVDHDQIHLSRAPLRHAGVTRWNQADASASRTPI